MLQPIYSEMPGLPSSARTFSLTLRSFASSPQPHPPRSILVAQFQNNIFSVTFEKKKQNHSPPTPSIFEAYFPVELHLKNLSYYLADKILQDFHKRQKTEWFTLFVNTIESVINNKEKLYS